MKRYWKIINNNTNEEMYVTAVNVERVELFILQNLTPDWFYLNNIIEVNADKTRKVKGDFSCKAVRSYFVDVYGTEDDTVILNNEFKQILARYKGKMA